MLFIVADPNVVKMASADPMPPPGISNEGGNGTEPAPPVPQDPPIEQPQREVEPGTVTQAWDNASMVSPIAPQREVRMVENDTQVLYETPYGNFFLAKDSPYFVGVSNFDDITGANKLADSAFLVMFQGTLLIPVNGTVDSASTNQLAFHYDLLTGKESAGQLNVTYEFHQERNKISASFSPSRGAPQDFQIVWLTFTTFDVLDTAYLTGTEQRFEDLENEPWWGTLFGTMYNIGWIERTKLKPSKAADLNRESAGLLLDMSDESIYNFSATYAGELGFYGRAGNAVLVPFVPGHLLIDPQLVLSGVDQDATAWSGVQRKTFFDGDRYWLFYKYTGGGTSEVRYQSSADGRSWTGFSDAVQIPGTLPAYFTVANYGKTVAVFWVDSASNLAIQVRTGLIMAERIQWDDAGHQLYSGTNGIMEVGGATFTSQGTQFGITWRDTGGGIGFARYTCTGQGSGYSNCAAHVQNGQPDWGWISPGNSGYSTVVAFQDGSGDIARFKVESSPSPIGRSFVRVRVYHADGTNCGDDVDIGTTEVANQGAWITDGLFTAAASGVVATIFYVDTELGRLYSRNIYPNCARQEDVLREGLATAKYLTAGTEQGGGALYLFYTAVGTAWHARIIPDGSNSWFAEPIFEPYTNPYYLTSAPVSSHFVPLLFVRAYPPPPGISDGCLSSWSNWCLYYVNYPLPLDGEAGVNNPWALKLGAPFVTDTGGVVSPATGLLASGQVLVGGTPSIVIIYREPGLFRWDSTNSFDVKYTSNDERYQIVPGIYYDVPWIGTTVAGMVHLQGGQKFPLTLTGISGDLRWYNNTRGIRYTLRYDGAAAQWTLTLPSGAYMVFESDGDLIWAYLDATGQNYLQYSGAPGVPNAYISDASGRRITFTATGLSYGNGQTIGLANLGVPAGCSGGISGDSATLQVTDPIGRVTKYSVCHWKLTKLESPNGGRVDYTYATYGNPPGSTNQVWQGTEAYSLPLLKMDIYNESGANVKARSRVFNWVFQNGEVVRALVNTTDKSAAVQGQGEYIFNPAMGTASVRTYDSAGQVLYYDMATLTGAAMKDQSGNANDGTISGPTDYIGKYGKARDFSGTSQWLETASSRSSLSMTDLATVSLWFQHDYAGTFPLNDIKGLFFKGVDTGAGHRNYEGSLTASGALSVSWASSTTVDSLTTTATYTDAGWHHLVGVFNWTNQNFAIYVDGTLAKSKFSSVPAASESGKLVIGKVSESSSSTRFLNGRIDEFRVLHRALSPEEIGILYSKNALKRGEQQNWFSINDQPHLVESFVGDETSPSVVTQDTVDDWGNQIYHRDASGNETFVSYANTNHQHHFYAPGSLTKNTGTQFNTEFIDFSEGLFPTGQGTWTVISNAIPPTLIDHSTFGKITPSLKVNAPSSGSTTIDHSVSAGPRFVEFYARVSVSTQQFEITMGTATTATDLGIRFTTTGQIHAWDNNPAGFVACTYPGGSTVTYAASTWYRFTFEIDADSSGRPWRPYLNGIDLNCGALNSDYAVNTLTIKTATSGTWSGWIDDIKVYNTNNGAFTGYDALKIGFSGLLPRQAIQMLSEDGLVIDQSMQTGTNTVYLSFNAVPNGVIPGPQPSGAYSYHENGDNARTIVRIYAEDGTLEYQSPLTRFFVGEQYAYMRPRAFADELVKTRSGALYWPNTIYADELGFCTAPITCGGTWNWRETDVAGAQTNGAARGVFVHVSPFGYGYREHTWENPNQWNAIPNFFVTSVRIPSNKAPDSIVFGVYGGNLVQGHCAYWGAQPPSSSCFGWGTGTYMGPVPSARDQWTILTVSSADIGVDGTWDGMAYGAGGGEVEWDVSTTGTAATLTVSGLNALGTGLRVSVYDPMGNTAVASATQSGDSATINLYKPSSLYSWTAFPVQANLKICASTASACDGTNSETNEYYFGPLRTIWPGDTVRYVGASSFFDPKTSSTAYWPGPTVHTSQIGSRRFSGDCWGAILCYDMETRTETTTAVDTGIVSSAIVDLSGSGSPGIVGGVPSLSAIDIAAAGLGMAFNAGSDELAFSMPTIDTVSGHYNTVSFWMHWTGTANQMPFGFDGYGLYFATTSFGFNTNNGDVWGIDNAGLANTRVHIVAEFYNQGTTNSKLFINGVQQTLSQKLGTPLSKSATTSAKISGWPTSSSYKFGGTIDQVQIFSRALSNTEVLALYYSRSPGAPQIYLQPTDYPAGSGLIRSSRVPYESTHLYAVATYDAEGNVLSVTDVGRTSAGGANVTSYQYSTLDGQDYLTKVVRPYVTGDSGAGGRPVYYGYDFQTGVRYGTLDVDCRRSRTQYDAVGRPLQTSIYDTDANEVFHVDMETFDAGNLKDVSCAGTTDSRSGPQIIVSGTTEKDGVEGVSRDFGPSTDAIYTWDSPVLSITGSFVLSAWVRWDTLAQSGGTATIVRKWDAAASKGYLLDLVAGGANDKKLRACIGNGAANCYYSTGTLGNSGTWYHTAVVLDVAADTVTFYINGLPAGQTPGVTAMPSDGTDPLTVGYANGYTSQTWDGSIDDVRVFNAVRSDYDFASLWRFTYKLLTRSSVAYDDMTANPAWFGYQFTSMTSYGATSIPRKLFLDMETQKLSNTIEDLSGNGNHVTNSGATVSTGSDDCKLGACYVFDGVNDYLSSWSTSSLNIAKEMSASVWIKVDTTGPTKQEVFAKGYSGTDFQFQMFVCKGTVPTTSDVCTVTGTSWYLYVSLKSVAGTIATAQSAAITTGSLIRVGFTYDGKTLQLYVGAGASGTTQTLLGPLRTTSQILHIGHYANTAYYFKGQLDEVHIFDQWLSPAEMNNLYNGAGSEKSHMSRTYLDGLGRTTKTLVMDMFGPTPPVVETLRPNGPGASAQWTIGAGCTANWQCVDETTAGSDGYTSYVTSSLDGNVDRYALTDPITQTGAVVSVTVHARADGFFDFENPPCSPFDPCQAKLWLMVNGYTGSLKTVGGNGFQTDFTDTWATNPATGNAWTISEVNSLEVGIKQSGVFDSYVSQLYVTVTFASAESWGQHRLMTAATVGWNDRPIYAYPPGGGYFTYAYDFLGRTLTAQTPGDSTVSGISRSVVSEKARMMESIDAVGRKAYSKTDLLGRTIETAVWNPATGAYGNLTKTTYNALSEITTATDANLRTTIVYYNSLGQPKMTVFPDGTYSIVHYDDNMRAFEAVDAMGRVSISAFDTIGRVTSSTLKPSFDIDQWINPVSGTSSYPNTWDGQTGCASTAHYDCVNDRAAPDDATSYVYTATTNERESHLMEDLAIPSGHSDIDVTWEGRCQRAASQSGGQVYYFVRETDGTPQEEAGSSSDACPSGSWQTFTHFLEVSPLGGEWTPAEINALECGYKSSGDVSPAPRVTNVRCRIQVTYPAYVTTYSYDAVHDDLKTIDNGTAKISRGYDGLHRIVAEKLEVPAGTTVGTIGYGYDNAGKVLNITYPVGIAPFPQALYAYDSLGRPMQVDYGGSKYAVLTYDSSGRPSNIHYWQGNTDTFLEEKYAYDARDRITQLKLYNINSGTVYMQQDYTSYSKASDILGVTDNLYVSDAGANGVSNPKAITLSYDGNGRLLKAVGPFGASQATEWDCYDYDAVGNIAHWGKGTTSCPTSGTTYYTYNYAAAPAWNKLDSITNLVTSFTYNAAGSMLTKTEGGTTSTYTHDFQQQLAKIVVGPSTYTYSYDGLGRRVKTVDSSATSYFMYSGSKMLYSKVGATETAFVYVGEKLLLRKEGTGATPEARYYHQDLSGNVRFISFYAASVQTDGKYRYKPFGDILTLVSPAADPRFKFANQEFDSGTSNDVRLYHMGARYHDPVVGRFIERDPIGPGYDYAANNPISFIDPSGKVAILGQLQQAWERGSQTPGGKTAINIALLAVAVATSIPTGGGSLAIYAVVGGLIVGAIFVAYAYVASGGEATFDDYLAAFTLGFTVGSVIGGGVGKAFRMMRAAPELGAARAGLSAEYLAGEAKPYWMTPRATAEVDALVARDIEMLTRAEGRIGGLKEPIFVGRIGGPGGISARGAAWIGTETAGEETTLYGYRVVSRTGARGLAENLGIGEAEAHARILAHETAHLNRRLVALEHYLTTGEKQLLMEYHRSWGFEAEIRAGLL